MGDDNNEQQLTTQKYIDALDNYLKNQTQPDWEAQMRRQRNAATMNLIGQIAQLGGQAFSASRGARIFQPINGNIGQYATAMDKIRDARTAYNQNLDKMRIDATYRDVAGANAEVAADKAHQRQLALMGAQAAQRQKEHERDRREAEEDHERNRREAEEDHERNRREALEDARANASILQQYSSGSGKQNNLYGYYASDGNYYVRNNDLSDKEIKQLAGYLSDKELDGFRDPVTRQTDYEQAALYAIQKKKVPVRALLQMGFTARHVDGGGNPDNREEEMDWSGWEEAGGQTFGELWDEYTSGDWRNR